jgi:hypothetical protein
MHLKAHERGIGGGGTFAVALLLITPSILAVFASFSTAHGVSFPASALWFTYQISLYLGYIGVVVVAVLTYSAAVMGEIHRAFVWLMGISGLLGIFLLWYAAHIYRNPWESVL